MVWNYRLVGTYNERYKFNSIEMKEVQYNVEDEPNSIQKTAELYSEDETEEKAIATIKSQLELMLKVLDKPILSNEDFPNEYKFK